MEPLNEKFPTGEERQIFFNRLLRKIFLEDWLMKIVALAITLALWFGVSGLSTPITTRMTGVPLNLRFSSNMEITNSPAQEVDIVITGDKRKISQINKADLIVALDLTDVQPGDRMIQLTPENVAVELPTGVRLEEVQPNKIAVKLEAVEEREIAVRAETEGGVAENHEIYNTIITPAKVRVRAPSSYIRALDFVTTEKINLENRGEDWTAKQVSLTLANPQAIILDTAVDVVFRIGEKRVEKTFLVTVAGDKSGKKETVVLYGKQSLLNPIRSENLQLEKIKTDAGEEILRLTLPPELQGNVEIRKPKMN